MMELTDILTVDEITRLAMMPGEPRSLTQIQAQNWLRQKNREEERRRQAHAEEFKREQQRQIEIHALHTKSITQPATDSGLTKGQVLSLAKTLAPVFRAIEKDIDALRAEKAATPPEAVQAYIEQRFADLQIDELKKTVEKLDDEAMRYRGVWRVGNSYSKGSLVTHASSMWVAERQTDDRPGREGANTGWKLSAKGPHK